MRVADIILVIATGGLITGCSPDVADGSGPVQSSRVGAPVAQDVQPTRTALCTIPAGTLRSFFPGKDEPKVVSVAQFRIEEHAVTNAQFLLFVRAVPAWRRTVAKRLFVDSSYLMHWTADLEFAAELADRPVVNTSWFAARAYAKWVGRRLPTLAEWERVAAATETSAAGEDPAHMQRILDWYSKSTPRIPAPIRSTYRNVYGVYDMHGLVWEWVDDFNRALVTGESRGDTSLERNLFCGSGSIGSADPSDYAAFMRFAFRSSLAAAYSSKNLGFRCAADANSETEVPR